ncbi:MAG: FAD-dependent oxidoreductase [archaeon]
MRLFFIIPAHKGILMEPAFTKFRISKITEALPGKVRIFRLEPVEGTVPGRKPGQYVALKLGEVERSYSLSGPVEADYLEVTVKLAGSFTGKLFGLGEGAEILASPPQGRFVLEVEKVGAAEIVFLAGGVGITPFSCFADYISRRRMENKVTLIYGSRVPSEIILRERIELLFSEIPNGKIVYTVDSAEPGWTGNVGFIGKDLLEKSVAAPKEAKYFICGPPPMVKAIVEVLKEMQVPLQNIALEGW